jgi:hypothetical protein
VTQLPPKNHLRWKAAGALKHGVLNSPDLPVSERLIEVVSAAAPSIERSDYLHQPLSWLLDAVKLGAELANVGWGSVPTDERIWPLAAHPANDFRWPACEILAELPGTRSPQATQVLVDLGHQYATKTGREAGVVGESVAGALGACPDLPEVRAALHLLRHNKQAPVRNQAQWSLARVGGRDAVTEFWEELASGRSSYDAETATQLVAKYGTVDDVPLAIRLLDRATRPTSPQWEPVPWGATMLQFLDRHSGRPGADERLRRFTRDFAKARPLMQAWVRANLPHLAAPTEPDADTRMRR